MRKKNPDAVIQNGRQLLIIAKAILGSEKRVADAINVSVLTLRRWISDKRAYVHEEYLDDILHLCRLIKSDDLYKLITETPMEPKLQGVKNPRRERAKLSLLRYLRESPGVTEKQMKAHFDGEFSAYFLDVAIQELLNENKITYDTTAKKDLYYIVEPDT